MSRLRRSGVTILQPAPPPDVVSDPDADEYHREHGRTFLPNSTDIAPVLREVTAQLAGTDVPTGFTRLRWEVVLDIVRDLAVKRCAMFDGEAPRSLLYRPGGAFLCGEAAADTLWLAEGRGPVDRGRVLTITISPLPRPRYRGGGQLDRPGFEQVLGAARLDAHQVSAWHVHADGRCWRPGLDVPPPDDDDSPAVALSARTRRAIARVLRTTLDDAPRVLLEDRPTLTFSPEDGTYYGLNTCPSFDKPPDHYLRVRVGPDSDIDDIEPWLDRVRVAPSGKVVMV